MKKQNLYDYDIDEDDDINDDDGLDIFNDD